jgi:glycosyltransferase involved in cell wall biosynthesis
MDGALRRVLMTTDAVGGVWTYSLRLAEELAQEGIATDLAIMGPRPDPGQRAAAARVPGLSLHVGDYKLEWMDDAAQDVARAGDWLIDLAAATAPDVVHLNGYAHAALPFAAPKLVVAHSCVLTWWQAVFRSAAPPRYSAYADAVRRGLDGADHVVAPTAAMLHALETCHGAVPVATVIPNGVSWAPLSPDRASKRPWIFSAGRLWDQAKNLAALLAVASDVPWPIRTAGELVLAEGPATLDATADLSAVTFLGRLDESEMAAAFADAAIYALPARYEPFGLSVLEAASHGCALVLGDIDSLRENWAGAALFVHPDDRDELASALRRLIGDPDLRAELAGEARRRSRRFSNRASARRYLGVYRELLNDRRREKEPACVS